MVGRIDEVLEHAETIVIGNGTPEFRDVPARLAEHQLIVDLVRVTNVAQLARALRRHLLVIRLG